MRAYQRTTLAMLAVTTLALGACSGGGRSPLPANNTPQSSVRTLDESRGDDEGHRAHLRFVSALELVVQGSTATFALASERGCSHGERRHEDNDGRNPFVGAGQQLDVPAFTLDVSCMRHRHHDDDDRNDEDGDGAHHATPNALYVVGVDLAQRVPFGITGPAMIDGTKLSFPASNAQLSLTSRHEYVFFLVDAPAAIATPTPALRRVGCPTNARSGAASPLAIATVHAAQGAPSSGFVTFYANTTDLAQADQHIACAANGALYLAGSQGVASFAPSTGTFAKIYSQPIVPQAGIAVDDSGAVYVAGYVGRGSGAFVKMAADGSNPTQVAIPSSFLASMRGLDLTEGSDGSVYAAAADATTGASTLLSVGTQLGTAALPAGCNGGFSIMPGTSAALYVSASCGSFTMQSPNAFSRVSALPAWQQIAHLGPDGTVYQSQNPASLTRIDPSTGATVVVVLPPEATYVSPTAAGSDGSLWFGGADAAYTTSTLFRLNLGTGTLSEYPLAGNGQVFSDLIPGVDGKLYGIGINNGVFKIDPALAGR